MSDFNQQLQSTRANLDRLTALASECPDLFAHASNPQANPQTACFYVHANIGEGAKTVNWRELAAKYRRAGWRRDSSAAYPGSYDWRGIIDGVEVVVIGAESRPEPQPLFEEVPA